MKLKTVEDIMATEPCETYSREIVTDLVGDGITEGQLVKLDIPREDVLWALIHVWLSPREQRQFACDCAERALLREREAGREPDRRSWEAVRVSRAFADGDASQEELSATRDAAGAATGAAAWAAIQDAAGDAAWAAARDAACAAWDAACAAGDAAWTAWDAAWTAAGNARTAAGNARTAAGAAAGAAAWSAARDAAWGEELEWQINQALTMTEKEIKIQKIKEAANQVVMDEKGEEAQRRSFAFGNAKIENEFVTKEMIDKATEDIDAQRVKPLFCECEERLDEGSWCAECMNKTRRAVEKYMSRAYGAEAEATVLREKLDFWRKRCLSWEAAREEKDGWKKA